MPNKIKLKRGLESNLPILDIGEPAFTTDKKNVYIGSSDGNIKLASADHDHDNQYYTKIETNQLMAELPIPTKTILYDSTENIETLYPGDTFDCNFSSYSSIEIWGKMPSSQFRIVIDLDIETSTFSNDHYEASDFVRRMNFNANSLGALISVTCSINKSKQQLKFHGAYVKDTFINGDTEEVTRSAYQICKIVAVQYPSAQTMLSAPLIS